VASTGNIDAYELYLEGRFSWNQRTAPALRRSMECLRRAVALDPGFAQAHAALAETCVTLGVYGAIVPATVMPQARDAAERALRLQPGLPEALAARGCVRVLHDWEPGAAEQDFRAAMAGARASSTIFQWFATNLLVPQRRFGEARLHLARARELDPVSPVVAVSEGATHYYERDHARAVQSYVALLDRLPEFGMAHYFLGLARAQLGEHEAAESALARASALLDDSDEVLAARAVVAALAGRLQDAHALLAELGARATTRYVSPVLAAGVLAQLDERDGAVALLEEAVRQRSADLIWIGVRPAFDVLRGDARFERIAAQVGVAG
jgi:serine/threonine-protein kinase